MLFAGALLLFFVWFRPARHPGARNVERQVYVPGPITPRELVTVAALLAMLAAFPCQPVLPVAPAWFGIAAIAIAVLDGAQHHVRAEQDAELDEGPVDGAAEEPTSEAAMWPVTRPEICSRLPTRYALEWR